VGCRYAPDPNINYHTHHDRNLFCAESKIVEPIEKFMLIFKVTVKAATAYACGIADIIDGYL
jgi:hypothetical protein